MTDHLSRWVAGSLLLALLSSCWGFPNGPRETIDLDAPDAAPGSMALEIGATACDPVAACKLVTAGAAKGSYAMSKTLTCCLAAVIAACGPINPPPNPPPSPGGAGGSVATGGATATGGVSLGGMAGQAGGVATGGSPATGGAVAVDWPDCAPPTQKARPVVRHKLGRKHGAITKRTRANYTVLPLPDVGWKPLLGALNQRDVGACTGFATLQCRLTNRWRWNGTTDIEALDLIALGIYSGATKRDIWPGSWPGQDTGSGGEWALDEAIAQGYFNGYTAVNTFEEFQSALQKQPCIVGTDWPEGFFSPDRCGAVKKTGANAGGHEWVVEGFRYETKQVLGRTSWDEFGVEWDGKSGFFWVTFGDFNSLITAGADMHCPWVTERAMQWSDAF